MPTNDILSHYDQICECGHKRIDHWNYQSSSQPIKTIERCDRCYGMARIRVMSSMEGELGRGVITSDHEFSEDFGSLVERLRDERK